MFKAIGVFVVIAGIIFGVALFKDYVNADVKMNITPKARQAVINGLDAAQGGVNTGLESAKKKIK